MLQFLPESQGLKHKPEYKQYLTRYVAIKEGCPNMAYETKQDMLAELEVMMNPNKHIVRIPPHLLLKK